MFKKMTVEVYVEPQYARDVKEAMLKAAYFKMNSVHEEMARHHIPSECTCCIHMNENYYACDMCSVLGNGTTNYIECEELANLGSETNEA